MAYTKNQPTAEQLYKDAEAAEAAMDKAVTKEDVERVWQEFMPKIGHKALGRILSGKSGYEAVDAWAQRTKKEA